MTTAAVSRRSKDRRSPFFPLPLALLLAESLAGALAPPCTVAGPVAVSESSSRARHRVRRHPRVLPVPKPEPNRAGIAFAINAGKPPPPYLAARQLCAAACAAASPSDPSQPSDLDRVAQIGSKPKSNPRVPVNHGGFAKEPLAFLEIKPRSMPVQKNF